jgi:arylsulfatase A-like enzyme
MMNEQQLARWKAAYGPKNQAMIDAKLDGKELSIWKFNRYLKDYLRCIKSVDDGVGELLEYLDENGLAENTVVIYTSDQGFYLGEHGWYDKRFMYEESFRTPLLIRYPKEIEPGSAVEELVQNLDYAPTILDYAGATVPAEMQGLSFRGLIKGKTTGWRDAIYYNYYEYPKGHEVRSHYGIRTERYKLINFYYEMNEWEMYDLERDPYEMNSVYDLPEYAEVRETMHKKLEELRVQYGDSDELNDRYIGIMKERYRKRR